MDNLARQKESYPVYQNFGEVKGRDGTIFSVMCDNYPVKVQRAADCYLEPEIGDRVLVAFGGDEQGYILSVLVRKNKSKQRLVFDGDTDVICKKGKLELSGHKGISVVSPAKLELSATEINVSAAQGKCTISRLSFLGSLLIGTIARVKLIAGSIESVCDRFHQKTKRSYKIVEDIEQIKAGKIDYDAEKLMSIRGKYSIITAKEDFKINGERIHMG